MFNSLTTHREFLMIQVSEETYIRIKKKAPRGYKTWTFSSQGGRWNFVGTGTYEDMKEQARNNYRNSFNTAYGIIKVDQ